MIQNSLSPHVNPVGEQEPGYGQLFAVLIRRFPWLLLVLLASVGTAYAITKKTPPTYKSFMQLLVEPNYQGRRGDGGTTAENQFIDPNVEIDTATQLNLMLSTPLMQKVVDKLKYEYPDITVGKLKGALVLDQIKGKEDKVATKIFQAQFTDKDPIKTKKVLDAVEQVYLEYNKKQQNDRLKKGLMVIGEQLKSAREEVDKAKANLQRFRVTQNLIDPEQQAKDLEAQLNSIIQERRATLSQYQEANTRYASIQKQLKSTPQNALVEARLTQSTRFQGLLNEIQKTELLLAQSRLSLTEEHPTVQKLVDQLQRQKELLQQEQKRTLGGDAPPVNSQGQSLLEQGQKSQIDLNLSALLVETETTRLALRARDQVLEPKERELRAELQRFPSLLAEYSRLQPQVQQSQERLQELLKNEQKLRQDLAKGGFNWEVVEEAQLGVMTGPNLQQNMLLGAVVGLMLGSIAAFVRESADDAVHTTAELEKQIPLPLLGTTPKLPLTRGRDSVIQLPFGKPEVAAPWTVQVLQSQPRWESLDLIFKNIELLNSVAALKSLMITSALADDGKSALALGLAMSAARLHKRVLLIDANLRNPSLHKQLNLPNEQGLSTLLASDSNLPSQISIQSSGSSYIDILTAGPQPADPAHLLSSPRMGQLIAAFEENYDLVLIDAPPVIGLVDAMLTGSYCRSVILAATIGRVTRTQLAQATAMLSKLNLIGVVANGVSNSNSTYVPYAKQNRFALQAVEK